MSDAVYDRVLLKLSGEAMKGPQPYGIDPATLGGVARQICEIRNDLGVEIGVVLGGGNIFRGLAGAARGMDRVTADHMGMLATVMNALAFRDALEKQGVPAAVLSAIEMPRVAELFTQRSALRHLDAGFVLVFAGGTGNPYVSTDTAAALRALEIGAGALLKATKVEGLYDRDPMKDSGAVLYRALAYSDVIGQGLRGMDIGAVTLCQDNELPIHFFDLGVEGNIRRVLEGEPVGTIVGNRETTSRQPS